MRTISIINQKGGIAKTSTASALGSGLSRAGKKVILIDLDAQCNLSYIYKAVNKPITALEVLTHTATAQEALLPIDGHSYIIPASQTLAGADFMLTETGKEYRLREALQPLQEEADFCIIDTPPSLGIVTINALTASDSVIIPTSADVLPLQGIGALSQTIEAVKKYCNPNLSIEGILLTRYSNRTRLSRDIVQMVDDIAHNMSTKIFHTPIRECIAIREAQAMQQTIYEYAPESNAVKDYEQLTMQILNLDI